MARQDLEELRDAIVNAGELSEREAWSIHFWGEDRLIETLSLLEAVKEAEIEYEKEVAREQEERDEQIEDEERERRETLADLGYEEFYDEGEIADYDDDGYWEVEITFDYGDD